MNVANVILGGAEKSGTTSIFMYLSSHPEVSVSKVKETDFFRGKTEEMVDPLNSYSNFFDQSTSSICLEASPAYLGLALDVMPRISTLLPEVKLIFVLREPVSRLLSSFDFHKSKFYIPEDLSFSEYFDLCIRFERGEITADEAGLDEWFLNVLNAGKYGKHLQEVYEHFDASSVLVLFYDDLCRDEMAVMSEVCDFMRISSDFYDDYKFNRENVTFSSKFRFLHRLAMGANDSLEVLWRRFPEMKRALLGVYKYVNEKKINKDFLSVEELLPAQQYYSEDLVLLNQVCAASIPDGWVVCENE